MAKLFDKMRDLWQVPEEMEDDYYEDDDREKDRQSKYERSSHRRSDDYSDDAYSDLGRGDRRSYSESYNSGDSYESKGTSYSSDSSYGTSNKVLNINATAKLQVVFFKPTSFVEVKEVADELMKSHTVLLNFEETPRDESKRIVDFISGSAYVSRGRVQRIAKNIFIVTPNNVDLKGDSLLDELQSNGMQID